MCVLQKKTCQNYYLHRFSFGYFPNCVMIACAGCYSALPLEVHGSGYTQMQMISNTKVSQNFHKRSYAMDSIGRLFVAYDWSLTSLHYCALVYNHQT